MESLNDDVGERLIFGEGTSKQEWLNWEGLNDLKQMSVERDFPINHRVLIIAPHPDDEILGCGGLMQYLSDLNREIVLVAVTNGTASHPESTIYTPDQLNLIRPSESLAAIEVLYINNIQRIELNIQDGKVSDQQEFLRHELSKFIQPNDILVCTFNQDGHPDHEFSAKVVQEIARQNHLRYYQVLIWAWHWATPNHPQIPWHKAYILPLNDQQLNLKEQAIRCFSSQLNIDPCTGQKPILFEEAVQRILMPFEVYIYEE